MERSQEKREISRLRAEKGNGPLSGILVMASALLFLLLVICRSLRCTDIVIYDNLQSLWTCYIDKQYRPIVSALNYYKDTVVKRFAHEISSQKKRGSSNKTPTSKSRARISFFPDFNGLIKLSHVQQESEIQNKEQAAQALLTYRVAFPITRNELTETHLQLQTSGTPQGDMVELDRIHEYGPAARSTEVTGASSNGESLSNQGLEEPFVGMVLQVGGMSSFSSQRDTKTPGDHGAPTSDTSIAHYELTERVYGELGLSDKHILDFAYNPVIKSYLGRDKSEDDSTVDDMMVLKQDRDLEPVHRRPCKSWLGDHCRHPKNDQGGPMSHLQDELGLNHGQNRERLYQTLGNTAFAGGSHGEIWKARRRCNLSPKQLYLDNTCDESEELIMKRLKVEQGARILEAGMREVYFGRLLLQHVKINQISKSFTTYVDHFFRTSASPQASESNELNQSELWIVFKKAGASLRSFLYTPIDIGGYLVYQNSDFWRRLRHSVTNKKPSNTKAMSVVSRNLSVTDKNNGPPISSLNFEAREPEGRKLMKELLRQLLTSLASLSELGVVHRDVKPSNIICESDNDQIPPTHPMYHNVMSKNASFTCVLGDFSSAWDEVADRSLYSHGLSALEQTNEYAPPEALFGMQWIPFDQSNPQSYDIWSTGVVALEMLLGTPNVFSVDQRTTTLLTHRLRRQGASEYDIQKALYLAALSQFCIYIPSKEVWPFTQGDPLHMASAKKQTCTLHDFHSALRARDPLGLGFDSSANSLLNLILRLLAWNPADRISAAQALQHPYFTGEDHALEHREDDSSSTHKSQILYDGVMPPAFTCPKCQRKFDSWHSCLLHVNSRKHAKFCHYDSSKLPPCLSSHSMLPAHPFYGYCDIQGRRPTIEDFHSIQMFPTHQFYGVFDGHLGNLASKFAASRFHASVAERLLEIEENASTINEMWKERVNETFVSAFEDLHEQFLQVVKDSPGGVMDESGTTATVLFVTHKSVVIANVGDSRAVLSVGSTKDPDTMMAMPLTVDHTPGLLDERKRVESLGGHVESNGSTHRVNGILAISRSIGDARLSHLLSRTPNVISFSRVEVSNLCKPRGTKAHRVGESNDIEIDIILPCFIVLASDGLWDVVSNQEAVDMVVEVYKESRVKKSISMDDGGPFQVASRRLTHEAYIRGSTDNIGVCVLALDP